MVVVVAVVVIITVVNYCVGHISSILGFPNTVFRQLNLFQPSDLKVSTQMGPLPTTTVERIFSF